MVRPTIPQTRRIGTRPDRFKSSEHPRVVIKDLDGLEADRIQASELDNGFVGGEVP